MVAAGSERARPVACPDCQAANSRFDRYCGACGQRLGRVRWSDSGGDWRSGDARIGITRGLRKAAVLLRNDGVVPVSLVLQEDPARRSSWLDVGALRGRVVRVPPGGTTRSIEIPVIPSELETLFRAEASGSDFEVRLPFLSSSGIPFGLAVFVARRPRIEPALSLYRFLPIERLRGDGVEHALVIHNEAVEAMELVRLELEDVEAEPPPDCVRILARELARPEQPQGVVIESGGEWTHRLRLGRKGLELPGEDLGWFRVRIRYQLRSEATTLWVESDVRGIVGRGPTLRFEGASSITEPSPSRHKVSELVLVNPGHLPVRLTGVEVRKVPDDAVLPSGHPDWLVLSGIEKDRVLSPGERQVVRVRFNRRARPTDEFDQEQSARRIVFGHDGWESADQRELTCVVRASFGRVEERTVGIDFGTSNSVVCIMGERKGYPLILEVLEGDLRRYLPSLMYFDGDRTSVESELGLDGDDARFLLGEAARGSANNEPANLVRSIKTVVAAGAREKYRFHKKDASGQYQPPVSRSPQELLNLFIYQLRVRAEDHLSHLPAKIRQEAGLTKQQVAFRDAVFSHPVEVSRSMQEALMRSAHAAGINQLVDTPPSFFKECCVDEATAAVLAYVDERLEGELVEEELLDLERVLCFDMGGGTTDIAALEIHDAAAFHREEEGVDRVKVILRDKRGDSSFGGDTLDRLIAEGMLELIRAQSEQARAPVKIAEVEHALHASSFAAYQTGYRSRRGGERGPKIGGQIEEEAYSTWKQALALLASAEKAKLRLTHEEKVELTLEGTGWPLESGVDGIDAGSLENFEVSLSRAELEAIVATELAKRLHLLDAVIEGAEWDWPSVTTLLFTGQSIRSPIIRRPVVDYVKQRRGEKAAKLILVEPTEGGRFDPKLCVAIGAAIWGVSREGEPWLELDTSVYDRLKFDLKVKHGRRYKTVKGLERGVQLPAEAPLRFPKKLRRLTVYRDTREFASFRFDPASEVVIRMESLADIKVVVGTQEYKGDLA